MEQQSLYFFLEVGDLHVLVQEVFLCFVACRFDYFSYIFCVLFVQLSYLKCMLIIEQVNVCSVTLLQLINLLH